MSPLAGASFLLCARRDSNPQPSDLWPLEQLAAASAVEWDDEDEYRRGQCVICSGDCDPGDCVMYRDALELAA